MPFTFHQSPCPQLLWLLRERLFPWPSTAVHYKAARDAGRDASVTFAIGNDMTLAWQRCINVLTYLLLQYQNSTCRKGGKKYWSTNWISGLLFIHLKTWKQTSLYVNQKNISISVLQCKCEIQAKASLVASETCTAMLVFDFVNMTCV